MNLPPIRANPAHPALSRVGWQVGRAAIAALPIAVGVVISSRPLLAQATAPVPGPLPARSVALGQRPESGFAYDAECRAEGVCAVGPWIATDTLTVFREFGSRAAVAFHVRRSQRLQGLRGRYEVQTPGLIVFDIARRPFSAGDTAYVLGYVGEGYSTLWYRGALLEDAPDGPGVRTIRRAEATWWLQVRNAAGARGWVPFPPLGAGARVPLSPAQ